MTKLLAAIDDSAAARPVLETAMAIARLFGVDVEPVHIAEGGAGRTARAAAEAVGLPLRTESGEPVARLAQLAGADDVVVVVVGARGWPGGTRPAGHVALELVSQSDKPVIIVPPETARHDQLGRILVALDGSEEAARFLRPTMDLATRAEIDIVVVHVSDEDSIPRFSDQLQHETEAFAREFVSRHCPGCEVRLDLRVGLPGERVVAVSDEEGADLVALAWSRNLAPGHARVVRHVLEHSRVPVLLVPTIPTT